MITPKRAIIVVARFADNSRRAHVCDNVEQVRAFVAGEGLFVGSGPYRQPLGRGVKELERDVHYSEQSELLDALRSAIA